MQPRYKLLFAFILFSTLSCFSQQIQKNIDSLLVALETSKSDSVKVNLYSKIASHYNIAHLDSARAYAVKGVELAEKTGDRSGQWENLNVLGNYYERKTDYDNAMLHYNNALSIVEELKSDRGFAVILNNIATIHIRKGEYDEALSKLFEALKAEEKIGNEIGIAEAYNNIGVVYYYTQDFDKTTLYLTKALEIQEELGNIAGLQNGYNNIGAIFDYQKKYDEAIKAYTKSHEISVRLGDKKQQASNLSNIALAYSKKGDLTNADAFFTNSLKLREEVADYNGLANTFVAFGEHYRTQGQLKKSTEYFKKGLLLAEEHGIKISAKEAYAGLSEVYKGQNDFKTANEYLLKFIAVKDSILNEKNSEIIAETEAKYQTEKKEKEILAQRAQLAEKELEVKRKNTLIYGVIGLAVVLGLLGYLFYSRQLLKNRQLQKESELKTALAKIETQNKLQEQRLRISRDLHDNIGAQLTFIISSLDNLKYGFKDMGDKLSEKLTGISTFTSQTIYELRDTIWAMNKNEITFEDLQARISNFIEKARMASESVNFSFLLTSEVDPDYKFSSVKGMNIYRIIQEAVNNALKYSEANKIVVQFSRSEDDLLVEIMDDGKGFNISEVTEGNGLANINKRAGEINATVSIDSEKEIGTGISFRFPL
tara:strand:+ start:104874 stop:106832 length:1959 start_codon:yes stop_codon:yes gene_type:complete